MSLFLRKRDIERAVLGELAPPAERRLFEHLRGCAPCRAHYDQLAGVKSIVDGSAMARARERARLIAAVDELRVEHRDRSRRRR